MEAIEDFHRRGIVYIELRFSPHLLATIGNDPLNEDDPEEKITPEDVLEEVLKAQKIAAEKYPSIMVRFLLCGIVRLNSGNFGIFDFTEPIINPDSSVCRA